MSESQRLSTERGHGSSAEQTLRRRSSITGREPRDDSVDDKKGTSPFCPQLREKFNSARVEEVLETTIKGFMKGKTYLPDDAMDWTTHLSALVSDAVKALNFPRYKAVCLVTLGENVGGGILSAMKTQWDNNTDAYATYTHITCRQKRMSGGLLEVHGHVEDWQFVQAYLLDNNTNSNTNTDQISHGEDDWSNTDWEWRQDEDTTPQKINSVVKNTDATTNKSEIETMKASSCLDDFIISNSPAGDALAIAKGRRAIFFKSECDVDTNRMKYSKCFAGDLTEEDGEFITSIVCIPLVSKKRTSPGGPDWTCIVVGFNRGYVRIYTETGSLLISQQFHNERVQGIKVRSFLPSPLPMQHDQLEEVIILYRRCVVTMDGFGLFQTLRACRNHLAKLKANATEASIDPPPLVYKKWGFDSDHTVEDCEFVGLNTPSTFDHLFTASILGGFKAKPKSNAPTSSIFASTGLKPFVAFHYAQENQAAPVLTDIAYAVASKMKLSLLSAASGWLGLGGASPASKTPTKELKTIEAPTPMTCRFGLPDASRHGKSIRCSPSSHLSVVTDALGRVTLIDNAAGIAVRMWKGYRDAQCSWVQVDEELSSKGRAREPRTALFLVIYAPRRAVLEVYAMQQGPRVASFNVKRQGRLLSSTFGMMGLNNVPVRGGNRPLLDSLFLDNEGELFTLNIPFHLALCDKTNSKVKDIHLLRMLQKLLRESTYTARSVFEILIEIRTQAMINQGFRVLALKFVETDVLAQVLSLYSQEFCDEGEKDMTVVFRMTTLLELYESLVKSQASPPPYASQEDFDPNDDKSLLYCLHASDKEISILEKMRAEKMDSMALKAKAVTFTTDSDILSLREFFASFLIEFDANKIKANATTTTPASSTLLINFNFDNIHKLGELLVCGCLNGTLNLDDWKQKLKNAEVDAYGILWLALNWWCQNSLQSSSHVRLMEKMYYAVKALCDVQGYDSVISNFNQVSKWWEEIRKELMKNSHIAQIYTFAIVCRAVAIDLQQQREADNLLKKGEKGSGSIPMPAPNQEVFGTSKQTSIDFENISFDLIKWNILIKQIEDLSLLSSVLVQRPSLDVAVLPILSGHTDGLTVIKLLDKGKGCIAELVGRWLTTIGIDPALISAESEAIPNTVAPDAVDGEGVEEASLQAEGAETGMEALESEKSTTYVLDLLRCLQNNFSVSLSPSIILSNYCWEYCLEWKNETNNVEYLGGAVKCAGAIPSPRIRQGMLSMIWHIFLAKKFASVSAISKVGKEKLVDRKVGFSTSEKRQEFLLHCVNFLYLLLETQVLCEGAPPPTNKTLRNHWSSDANANAPLTDLALFQPLPNFDMILLHYELALCAQFFCMFRIKGALRPTNLFDTKSRSLFFQNLHNPASFTNVGVDLAVKTLREEFLCLVMSAAIRAIPEDPIASDSKKADFKHMAPTKAGVQECEEWTNKVFELGRIWRLELDGLRISHVCELYSSGLDSLGLEAMVEVNGRDVLGTRLLIIAGMRMSYVINLRRENVMEIISSISTNLSNWLDSLEYSKLRSLRFPPASIEELSQQILTLIPENSYDYKLARELLTASSFL